MEVQYFQDQNGYFPADLMACIANYACIRTVTAMLLTSKYWSKIISPLLAHPAVTIISISRSSNLVRTLHHFRRGRGYRLWAKNKEDGVYPRERRQDSEAFIGYFPSLLEMRNFLEGLRTVLTDPNPEAEISSYFRGDNFYAIIGTSIDDLQYYNMKIPVEADPADILRANLVQKRSKKLGDYLLNAGFINTDHNHMDTEHISIEITHQTKNYFQRLTMTILADGDAICAIDGKVFRTYRVRTSKKLFANLLEIIRYSKHKRKMEKKSDTEDQKTIYSFNLAYEHPSMANDEETDEDSNNAKGSKSSPGYYIQHLVRRNLNTNRYAIETNGYKTGALDKVVKLLEDALFNPKSKGPTLIKEKRVILPPQSKGNALFDSVRFDPKLRSVGIPNMVAIVMYIEQSKLRQTDQYVISIDCQTSLADLKDTLKFFCRVEDALETDQDKKLQKISHVINDRYRIFSLRIYTYSPTPVVEVPKSVLDLIAEHSLTVFFASE